MKNADYSPFIKEAKLYEKQKNNEVRCLTCERRCIIKENLSGFCNTRKNMEGKLYTLVYGNIAALSCNPIEKKPFFHFYPGSRALTSGTFGCNFTCPWCQNWDISKSKVEVGNFINPSEFIKLTKKYNCQGTSISFNEPTLLLEWTLEVFPIARKSGLYNTFVTNGYMTEQTLNLLINSGLNAMNVDIKGDKEIVRKYCGANLDFIFRNCKIAKEKGLHIEITTLIVSSVNDQEETLQNIAKDIINTLGKDTPWHLTKYYPAYEFLEPPTSKDILENAYQIAKSTGFEYVYIGNLPGHHYENTYCPSCGKLLIKRYLFDVLEYKLTSNKKCPNCHLPIPLIQ